MGQQAGGTLYVGKLDVVSWNELGFRWIRRLRLDRYNNDYYCNPSVPLKNDFGNGQETDLYPVGAALGLWRRFGGN